MQSERGRRRGTQVGSRAGDPRAETGGTGHRLRRRAASRLEGPPGTRRPADIWTSAQRTGSRPPDKCLWDFVTVTPGGWRPATGAGPQRPGEKVRGGLCGDPSPMRLPAGRPEGPCGRRLTRPWRWPRSAEMLCSLHVPGSASPAVRSTACRLPQGGGDHGPSAPGAQLRRKR